MKTVKEKYYPKVGDRLYMRQKTGNYWVDSVRKPYTVIAVTPSKVTVQAAKCIFIGPQYYDSLPEYIEEDKEGRVRELSWAPKKGVWQYNPYRDAYPEFAVFGEYDYQPYLN